MRSPTAAELRLEDDWGVEIEHDPEWFAGRSDAVVAFIAMTEDARVALKARHSGYDAGRRDALADTFNELIGRFFAYGPHEEWPHEPWQYEPIGGTWQKWLSFVPNN